MQTAIDAIANPYRREILRLLWGGEELSSGEIARHFPVTWQSISRNLKVLRTAGLVAESRRGAQRDYRADRAALRPLEDLLHRRWEQKLDKIGALAAEDQRGRRGR